MVATNRGNDTVGDCTRNLIWPGQDISRALAQATHVLVSIAPNETGDPVLNAFRRQLIQAAPHIIWVGYLSTTAVYGDQNGCWVDESTPTNPATNRGRLRVQAEIEWQKQCLSLHIFRLAGIYGPGRGPFEKVKNGTARRIVKPAQVFSRIHVEDLAHCLEASINNPKPGAIYNLCDDNPAPPQEVIAYAAKLLELPIPPAEDFETARMTPMARSFYGENKRVRNQRIKTELGIRLMYPDYRAGLASLMTSN